MDANFKMCGVLEILLQWTHVEKKNEAGVFPAAVVEDTVAVGTFSPQPSPTNRIKHATFFLWT